MPRLQATLIESALAHWTDTFPELGGQRPPMAMAHCAAGFVAGLPLVSRQAGLQLLHLLDALVIGPLLAFSALCELLAITCLYGLEHFRLDVLLMHGEAWAPVLEAAWKWFLPTLLSVTLAGGLLTGGCGGAEAPQDLPGACMAAWLLIAVGVAQVPLWAIKAAMSRHDSAEGRCLVPSSIMEMHHLSTSDASPRATHSHP
ncbi:sodium- and chloride-dependent glycine transporter 2-like [Amblyomma americanum]